MSESNVFHNLKLEDNVLKSERKVISKADCRLNGNEEQLQAFIDYYGFFASRLTAHGTVGGTIGLTERERLASLAFRYDRLSDADKAVLEFIKREVSEIVTKAIKLTGEEATNFQAYFKQLVAMELLENNLYNGTAYATKEGIMLDYKISRISRYLGIQLNVEEIADFTIGYDGSCIKINGQDYYRSEQGEARPAKKFGIRFCK
ncbi:MAG: hypothetical protein E7173_02930 [Firmicutes bacterium]|nr:hypothetical protein [Bacillota bacterium]